MKKIKDIVVKGKAPEELMQFTLELVGSNGSREYRYNDMTIIEQESMSGEFYPLSTKEILTILYYYKALKGTLRIIHTQIHHLQGFMHSTGEQKITLYIPSKEMVDGRAIKSPRYSALFTLLHELGHVLGYSYTNPSMKVIMENKADEFAEREIVKFWGKLIKE
jgi:hypothetical protein